MKDNRNQLLNLAEQRVRLLYTDAYTRALKIAEVRKALDAATDTNFTFRANPRAEKELKKILQALGVNLDKLITDGKAGMAKKGVTAAEDNILAIVAKSDKPTAERLIQAATTTNRVAQALGTELANEKRGGVKLSPKVWKTVETSRKELEIIIQNNIIEGKGADVASREVRQYLKDPNRLFRRVKDKETGEYKLSKAAQQYHPGQGKYRSSYMNARRLTVTEMNMATQAAESAAYASNPLIAGYEIRLSNNHTVKDPSKKGGVKPLHDICDELAGNYPATFKFTGWHPHCRCTMIPILISAEERRKLAKARAEGKDYQPKGVITDVPDNYKQWVADNQDRIADAKTLPYFLQDNGVLTDEGYKIGEFPEPASDEPTVTTQEPQIVDLPTENSPETIRERAAQFVEYDNDPNYKDVEFNPENGALKATHTGHFYHKEEDECQQILFETGNKAVLLDESAKDNNNDFLPSLDLELNGKKMDIRTITEANENTIRNGLNAKDKQIRNVFNKTGVVSDSVCLYFRDAGLYSTEAVLAGINAYKKNQNYRIKYVYCVVNAKKGGFLRMYKA